MSVDALAAVPPAALLVAGALALLVLPRRLHASLCVALPALTLAWLVFGLEPGASHSLVLLDLTLVPVRVDRLSLLFGGIFSVVGVLAAIYAWHVADRAQQMAGLLYTAGALGVTFAGDYISLYLAWELMALASVVLVWARRIPDSTRAGWRYLGTHLVGGAVLLAGILLHVHGTDSIAFERFAPGEGGAAAWLILAGFCLNAAVPPLGAWLPDAYPRATITGAVFCSALTTKSAVYVLLRTFPGWEILVLAGVVMALYGVVYAVLANDIRELLAYHIISQVGYMLAGVGLGTELALNGAAAHAVCHILYKSLLFMGAGAVLHSTGSAKLTELGGLLRRQKLVFALYMIGAFSISGVPLWNGFISKSMVVASALEQDLMWVFLALMLASVGTFLHTGLKLPYGVWFGEDRGLTPTPVPRNMIVAMAAAAALCTFLGLAPGALYGLLPYAVDWDPFTTEHVMESLELLAFTFFAFVLLIPLLHGRRTLSLDTDVLYRKPARLVRTLTVDTVGRLYDGSHALVGRCARGLARVVVDPAAWVPGWFERLASDEPDYDEDRARLPLAWPLGLTLLIFAVLALLVLG
jgi:multicomponent Na+:H+ antiporter subunit D